MTAAPFIVSAAPPKFDWWLMLLCGARMMTAFMAMTYPASLPLLKADWDMTATQAGAIATSYQLGYALSLVIFSSLADRLGAKRVFLVSATLSAILTLIWAFFARDFWSCLILLPLTTLVQGGTYTPAIMLIAERYPAARRGAAIGWLLASSSCGYVVSLFAIGALLAWSDWQAAFIVTGFGPVVALVLGWLALRPTMNAVHARTDGQRFAGEVLRNRKAARLIGGYTFHTWELLGMWAWTPAFLAACLVAVGYDLGDSAGIGAYLSASFHITGFLASFTMGRASDRMGRRTVMIAMAALATACSFSFGWMIGMPVALVVVVAAIYGFFALGDSPALSVALTESVSPAYLGAALALRSTIGFTAGALAPVCFGVVLDLTNPAGIEHATVWGWAFGLLGIGGLIATICAWSLPRDR